MALTFRGQKGTSLTHDELDNNFREFYYSASYDGSGLFLYKSQSLNNVTNLPFQAPVGRDYYVQFKLGNAPSGSDALFSGSNNFKFDYRENTLQLTGSQNITGDLVVGGTVTAEEFITEKVATSYIYKSGSTKFGDDLEDNHAFTGSVDIQGDLNLVGPQTQEGNLTITGSLKVSGSKVEITGSSVEMLIQWPEAPGEFHLLQTDPFTVNLGPRTRTYQYAAFALDHYEGGWGPNHNAFKLYMYDSAQQNFGSEFLLGPVTTHLRMKGSGSGHLGGVDISDVNDGSILSELYGDNVQVGVFRGTDITIGNSNSTTNLEGAITSSGLFTEGDIHSTNPQNKIRFHYDDVSSLPSPISYHGMFAHTHAEGKAWYAHAGNWVELATSSSIANNYLKNTTDTLTGNLTISDTVTTNNLNVLGTGSFGYIQSITGSAKIIGDAYIVVNTNSPAERYAGIKVYDSGSADTGSLEYDSVNNHWFYESTNEGYASGLIAGPRNTRGSITFPSVNTLVKGLGGNHIGDSIISDSGSVATINGDLTVTGVITGTLTGSIENAVSASYLLSSDIVGPISASYIEASAIRGQVDISSQTNLTAGTNITIVGDTINATDTNTTYSAGTGMSLTGTTFSIGQSVGTADTVTFGEVRSSGDIIAYASSDERLKDNIKLIPNAVEKVQQIKGVSFDWNSNQATHHGHDIGVIAQDIEQVLPEVVTTRANGYKAVRYEKIVALLIEAVKEQQLQIEELKSKL